MVERSHFWVIMKGIATLLCSSQVCDLKKKYHLNFFGDFFFQWIYTKMKD